MIFPYLFIVVTTLTVNFARSALILPVATTQLINQTSEYVPFEVGDGEKWPECFPPALIGSRLAESRDCLLASMMLSTADDSGFFNSNGDIPDQFLLPVTKVHGTCNVTVSIDKGITDQCSWSTIENVASQLVQACSAGYYPNGKSGGITRVGRRGQIRVAMGKIGQILSIQNTTGSSEDSSTR